MTKYNLVNPYIEGGLKTTASAKNEMKAAAKIYNEILSPIFITSAPKFNFSIEGGGKYYHFTVKENVKGENVKFKIEKFNGKVDNGNFAKKIGELQEQEGGKRKHKDDDSSSSSSSDSPPYYSISRYCYSPYIYTPIVTTSTPVTISYTAPFISPHYLTPSSYFYYWYY